MAKLMAYLPTEDRPREKILARGPGALSDEELVALLLGSGIKGHDVMTVVHPREVFADPITDRGSAIILAHNHPSGNIEPSREDIALTRRLKESGETLGITVLDHIIFARKGHYSFLENGNL